MGLLEIIGAKPRRLEESTPASTAGELDSRMLKRWRFCHPSYRGWDVSTTQDGEPNVVRPTRKIHRDNRTPPPPFPERAASKDQTFGMGSSEIQLPFGGTLPSSCAVGES